MILKLFGVLFISQYIYFIEVYFKSLNFLLFPDFQYIIIMGQACSFENKYATKSIEFEQITHEQTSQKQNWDWSKDVNVNEDNIKIVHKIPKPSQLKIKTLTDKNLQSDKSQRSKKISYLSKNMGLQFFMQFGTLKQLIQQKQKEIEQNEQQNKQNLAQSSVVKNSADKSQIGESLNKYIRNQKIFQNAQINIQDFIRISQQPITQYYDFKQKIGEGSFGNVYRAICKTSKQERAIKVLKKKQMSKQSKKQFLAEMELLSKLDHPNIIKVYQLYYYNQFYYVVTQFCKGGTILNYVNQHSNYGEKFISKIMRQLLSALLYLHHNYIVHLDIKLENIVFLQKCTSQNDKVYIKLIDFGCSKTYTPYKKKKAKIAGTLSYIAPECLQGYYSEKCDIWSTGVLLHILLTGISPFKGKDSKQTVKNIEKKQLTYEGKHWQKISKSGRQLLQHMLTRNPSKRISARNALQHNWFDKMKNSRSAFISKQVVKNLQKYYRCNNLVTIIETFISLRKVNQQQRKRLTDLFQVIDTDNSGCIQINQLLQIYKQHFGYHDEGQIQHIINKIDLNKSSSINFNQFLVAMSDRKDMFQEEHLLQAFNYFDVDRTGFIEKNELKQILKGCEKQQFQFILKELDKDGDQKISKQQFTNYLSRF